MSEDSICILPRLEGVGGPASFRARLTAGLAARGIRTHAHPEDPTCRAILVIGGTRRLDWLLHARRRGIRIVQRLDGMNWLHRLRWAGLGHFLRSEANNALLALIRRWLAERIVYQSSFTRDWWHTVYGPTPASGVVIYNGVDLKEYSPDGAGTDERPTDRWRLLVVEGHLNRAQTLALENAIEVARGLAQRTDRPVELWVAGDISPALRTAMELRAPGLVRWLGVIDRRLIPALDRSAHLLYSAEINPPCPNAVIEALACGLPVIGFAAGALPELLDDNSGRMTPWGGNIWKLQKPDCAGLSAAARSVLEDQPRFRAGARARAEKMFGLDQMVEKYLHVLLG